MEKLLRIAGKNKLLLFCLLGAIALGQQSSAPVARKSAKKKTAAKQSGPITLVDAQTASTPTIKTPSASTAKAVASPASVSAEPPVETHIRFAAAAEQKKDLASAESEYKQALQADPNSTTALGSLSYLYATQKRYAEAEPLLRRFVKLDPDNASAHEQLGVTLLELKQADAIAELQTAWNKAAKDIDLRKRIANDFALHDRLPQAEIAFSQLLRIEPANAELTYSYASVLMNQKKFQHAEAALQRTVALKPDFADAYGDLAVVAAENQDFPAALAALDRHSQYVPDSAATYFLRATSFDHLKDFHRAADNYRKFLAADGGKSSTQEWQAKHRLLAIEKK